MTRWLSVGLAGLLLFLGMSLPVRAAAPPPVSGLVVTDSLLGGAVTVDWSAYTGIQVSAYALYVSTSPLTTVLGLTPWRIYLADTKSASVMGLVDGQDAYFAVVPINGDLYEPRVQSVMAVPRRQGVYGVVTAAFYNPTFPVPNVLVLADNDPSRQVYTDSAGRYCITGLATGSHTLSFSSPTARSTTLNMTVAAGSMTQLDTTIRYTFSAHNNPPTPPTNLQVKAGDGKAILSWDAVLAANVTGYNLYRFSSLAEAQSHTNAILVNNVQIQATSYVDMSLVNGQDFWYTVRAFDGNGTPGSQESSSSNVVAVTPRSQTLPPIDLRAQLNCDGSVTLNWVRPVASDLLGYRVYQQADATMDYAEYVAVDDPGVTTWTSNTLTSGATYTFAVRSYGSAGAEDNTSVRVGLTVPATWNQPRAAISIPKTGKRIDGNALHVQAEPVAAGCGIAASDGILFQYRLSGGTDWIDIPAALAQHPNPDLAAPFFTKWDVTALAEGVYDLRAVAAAGSAVDPAPGFISVTVDHHQPEITETRFNNARFLAEGLVESGRNSVVEGAGAAVGFASSSLGGDTRLRLTLPAPEEFTSDSSLLGGPVGLTLASGQSVFPAGSEVTVGLPYADGDGDGVIDGLGYFAADARVAAYNPTSSSWEVLPGAALDAERQQVSGQTAHFSYFQLRLKDGLVPAELPAKPQGPTLSTSGSFRLAWEPAPGDGVLYELQSATSSDFSQGAATCYVGPLPSAHVTATVTGSGYFRVRTLQPGHAPSPWTEVVAVPVALNYGDVNLDDQVDAVDALLALQMAVGRAQPDLNADLGPLGNGVPAPDGTITAGDALLILRKAVGLW